MPSIDDQYLTKTISHCLMSNSGCGTHCGGVQPVAGGYHNVNFGCELLSNEVTILGVVFRPKAQADYFHKLLV